MRKYNGNAPEDNGQENSTRERGIEVDMEMVEGTRAQLQHNAEVEKNVDGCARADERQQVRGALNR